MEIGFGKERVRQRRLDEGRAERVDANADRSRARPPSPWSSPPSPISRRNRRARIAAPTWPICEDMLMMEPFSPARRQPARHGLGHEEGARAVEPHDQIVILDLHLEKGRGPVGAGIVDQDMIGRPRGDGRLPNAAQIGDVEARESRPCHPSPGSRQPPPRSPPPCARPRSPRRPSRPAPEPRHRGRCRGPPRSPARACRRGGSVAHRSRLCLHACPATDGSGGRR